MKSIRWLTLTVLLGGCVSPTMTVVNNTPFALDVTANNTMVCTNLMPGVTCSVPATPWIDRVAVVVTAHDPTGRYIGAEDWTFYCGQPQVWRIDRLHLPGQ